MTKTLLPLIALIFLFLSIKAQGLQKDSVAIISAAKQDAKNFMYNKANKKAVLRNLHNPASDYFKPSANTSNVSLLNDSLYVKTFKIYAVKHIRARRTTKTLLFVGGGVVIFFGLIVAALVAAGPGLTN